MMPPLDSGTGYALKASPSYRMIEYTIVSVVPACGWSFPSGREDHDRKSTLINTDLLRPTNLMPKGASAVETL